MTCANVVSAARACLLAGLTGCATLAHGTKQVVPITSSPPGAPVTIDGVRVGVTPYDARLSRSSAHRVMVGADPATQVHYALDRRLSLWLLSDLVIFYPAILIDLVTSAGFAFTHASVHADLPAGSIVASANAASHPTAAAARDSMAHWGLYHGQQLRLTTPESRGKLMDASLDSIVGGRLYWRPAGSATWVTPPPGIPLADIRGLQVRLPPAHFASGGSLVHAATQLAWVVPLVAFAEVGSQQRGFKAGAAASAVAIPVSFLAGAAFARSRWAPFEARRAGSPLLVNDHVRVRRMGSGEPVSGRLVDLDSRHLAIRVGADTVRVLRTNVVALERADGFNLRGRALYAAAAGVIFGFSHVSTCGCRTAQSDMYTVPLSGALLGLLAAPALAPRRWRSVSAW